MFKRLSSNVHKIKIKRLIRREAKIKNILRILENMENRIVRIVYSNQMSHQCGIDHCTLVVSRLQRRHGHTSTLLDDVISLYSADRHVGVVEAREVSDATC